MTPKCTVSNMLISESKVPLNPSHLYLFAWGTSKKSESRPWELTKANGHVVSYNIRRRDGQYLRATPKTERNNNGIREAYNLAKEKVHLLKPTTSDKLCFAGIAAFEGFHLGLSEGLLYQNDAEDYAPAQIIVALAAVGSTAFFMNSWLKTKMPHYYTRLIEAYSSRHWKVLELSMTLHPPQQIDVSKLKNTKTEDGFVDPLTDKTISQDEINTSSTLMSFGNTVCRCDAVLRKLFSLTDNRNNSYSIPHPLNNRNMTATETNYFLLKLSTISGVARNQLAACWLPNESTYQSVKFTERKRLEWEEKQKNCTCFGNSPVNSSVEAYGNRFLLMTPQQRFAEITGTHDFDV